MKTPGRFVKVRMHSFLSTPIKGLSVILITQVIDLYSYLPGQFFHDQLLSIISSWEKKYLFLQKIAPII